jgi:hypothetical protein
MCPFYSMVLIFTNCLAEQLRHTLIQANTKIVDTLLAAIAPTPVAQTAVAIGSSDCIDLTNDDDDDDLVVTGSRMVGHAIDTNPRQRVSQVNAICIESDSESDVPPPRRLGRPRATADSIEEDENKKERERKSGER